MVAGVAAPVPAVDLLRLDPNILDPELARRGGCCGGPVVVGGQHLLFFSGGEMPSAVVVQA